jgi:hypothetical protein
VVALVAGAARTRASAKNATEMSLPISEPP